MCIWNVAGMKNKPSDFWADLSNYDILGLLETWVDEEGWSKIKPTLPKNYTWKCQAARKEKVKGRAMGGIVTGVKKDLEEEAILEDKYEGIQERRVIIDKVRWNIFVIYSNQKLSEIRKEIDRRTEREESNPIIMGGDFNARIGQTELFVNCRNNNKEEEIGRKSKDKKVNQEGQILLDWVSDRDWNILNGSFGDDMEGEHTYVGPRGSSVVDYLIVNEEAIDLIKNFNVGENVESDHQPLILETKATLGVKIKYKRIMSWTDEAIQRYKENLKAQIFYEVGENIDDVVNDFLSNIRNAIQFKTVVDSNYRSKDDWWDWECKESKQKLREIAREIKFGIRQEEDYYINKKKYKQKCEQKRKIKEEEQINEIKQLKTEGDIWRYIKEEKKQNRECREVEISVENWDKHCVEQLSGSTDREILNLDTEIMESDGEITMDDIREQIGKLKRNKMGGPDSIPNEAWANLTEEKEEELLRILNKIWKGNRLPSNWRNGYLCPIYKKGCKSLGNSYRCIALMDTAYKIYTKILQERLMNDIENKRILQDNQTGFRKGRGVIENIYTLNYIVEKEIKKPRGKLYAMFLDIKAAFDHVNRVKLLEIMRKKGINENLIKRVGQIYQETKYTTKIGEEIGSTFWTRKGLKQGCPLSPCLFNIYLSDMEDILKWGQGGGIAVGRTKKVWSLSYADDTVMFANNQIEMVEMLKRMEKYFDRKDLQINVDKSKIVIFRKGSGRMKKEKFEWKGTPIECVKNMKYLGYYFNENNTASIHVKYICKKASVAARQLWLTGNKKFKSCFKIKMFIFDAVVKSILMFGSEVWGWKEEQNVEKIQLKYIKNILHLDKTTASYMVREESKRYKLRIEAAKRAIKFEDKINMAREVGLIQNIFYEINKEKAEENTKWNKERKELYKMVGLSECEVENQRKLGINMAIWVQTRLEDIERQMRYNSIQNSKYERYRSLLLGRLPKYLTHNREDQHIIARWRCGNEERINKYWLKEEQKKCKLCEDGEDSLQHWILECRQLTEAEKRMGKSNKLFGDEGEGIEFFKEMGRKKKLIT